MNPRSNDSNASSAKQKKKQIESHPPPSVSLLDSSSPSSPDALLTHLEPAPASAQSTLNVPDATATHNARVALSASPSTAPRVFVASTLKPVSTIDSVTSTISAISHHANRGISSLIAAHTNTTNSASPHIAPATAADQHATPLRSDGSVSPIYDAFHNAGSTPDPAHIQAALHNAAQPTLSPQPRVVWSRWDRLPLKSHPLKFAPLLLSYFDNGSLQALLLQDRTISELLSLPNAADVLLDRSASVTTLDCPHLLTALVRPPSADTADPQLLLVVHEPDNATRLLAYSLTSHQVQASIQLQHHSVVLHPAAQLHEQRRNVLWPQVQAQCNQNYLVLSFAAPASIHVLSTSTLEYIGSPILEVSAASAERPPPISLSHRLLAFACTASKNVSPIRSDARKASNSAYHDPARTSFAAVPSDASPRVGEMRDNLFETSAHVGDAARRIRGGVISGVRTLGEWGSSYWPQAGSPPAAGAAFSPPQSSLLSQSAPHTASHLPRQASSASSSPMLLAVDGGRAAKRLSTGAPSAAPNDMTAGSGHSSHTVYGACVRVIDLASDTRTICTFAPSNHAVTLVSFSPCGRLILTADTLGHAFHVFELPLSGTFGNAATTSSSSPVLHRYKLMRGITTADVVHAQWSSDAQWLTVGTHSGTVHIYAVNPFGGIPSIANHVQAKIKNPQMLQPFGLSLSSLARSVRPTAPPQQEATQKSANPIGAEAHVTAAADVQSKLAPAPSFLLVSHASSGLEGDVSSPFELVTNDPRSVSVTLHNVRCWSTQTRAPSARMGSEEVQADAKHRFAPATSPRTSGLSQMMRKAGEGLLPTQQAPRLQAECVRVALWDQLLPDTSSVTKHSVAALGDQTSASYHSDRSHNSLAKPLASVAKAEIETYSQSPAMLPSSIFLSRQTFFHARTRSTKPNSATATGPADSLRCIQRRGSRPIQVRRTARLVSREPSSEEASSFDDSLAGALDQMSFNPEHLPPRSASAHIPSFPQGQRGRSAGWTAGSSIPIRIVAGGLGGIYRAGKELGRGVDMARRRTSGASGTEPPEGSAEPVARNTASISFDAVDDVDLLGEDEDAARSSRHRYRDHHNTAEHIEQGSTRSDLSMLSVLHNDEPGKGSQPSSAETPSTRFSEVEDVDECDWDAIDDCRSPAAPAARLLDDVNAVLNQSRNKQGASGTHGSNTSMDDDFTVGMLDEDSDQATVIRSQSQSQSGLTPIAQDVMARASAPKELVYALPAGGSTRSSLLSQSSGKTSTVVENRLEAKADRDSSPSNSDEGDSASQRSVGSGMLCEGSKETHTIDVANELDASAKAKDAKVVKIITAKPISTSGGGGKKKKKSGR